METRLDWISALGDGYELLSELFSQGLHKDNLERIHLSPLLENAVDEYGNDGLEQIACDHQHVFGWSIYPYESVFLDETTEMGGEIGANLLGRYRQFGVPMSVTVTEPDHIATELMCLAHLCQQEVASLAQQDSQSGMQFKQAQNEIIETHLLRWLPALRATVLRSKRIFPSALMEQTLSMVLVHYSKLQEELGKSSSTEFLCFSLPAQPSLLDDANAGLREIATLLACPALSGIFLSRDDIATLSSSARLPKGFGKRVDLLHNLLVAAARFDGIAHILEQLSTLIESWQHEIRFLIEQQGTSLEASLVPWLEQSNQTKRMLGRMLNAAKAHKFAAQGK